MDKVLTLKSLSKEIFLKTFSSPPLEADTVFFALMYNQNNFIKKACKKLDINLDDFLLSAIDHIMNCICDSNDEKRNTAVEKLILVIKNLVEIIDNPKSPAINTVNKYYGDLVARAILKNNITCAKLLISEAPKDYSLEITYYSKVEIEIKINKKLFFINIKDGKNFRGFFNKAHTLTWRKTCA